MARQRTYTASWGDWQGLLAKLAANIAELSQLEPFRAKLAATLAQVVVISSQQATLRAGKQEASKQLRKLVTEGNRTAAVLRAAIKEHYGPTEEKVAEFGLQPFRGRKTKPQAPLPQTPVPGQPETADLDDREP